MYRPPTTTGSPIAGWAKPGWKPVRLKSDSWRHVCVADADDGLGTCGMYPDEISTWTFPGLTSLGAVPSFWEKAAKAGATFTSIDRSSPKGWSIGRSPGPRSVSYTH